MSADSLTITDNRTGKQYQLPIQDGTIKAMDLRQIKESDDDFGLMTYDPAFMNTASCKSRITFIDGDKGILEYRAIQSISLPRRVLISKWLTCCCTVNCRPHHNSPSGPTTSPTTPSSTKVSI